VATLTVSDLTVGTHSITASYAGDASFAASDSTALSQQIEPDTSTEVIAVSVALDATPNPAVFGQTVTFTATVAPVAPGTGTPSGAVTFFNGSTTLGTASLSDGVATLTVSDLTVGTHSITVSYAGDASFATDTSAVLQLLVEAQPASTTTRIFLPLVLQN
jgi:hypothetical protein